MALTKKQKKEILESLKERIDRQKSIVFVGFTGIKVKDFSNLRRKTKTEGGELLVAKKTLINLALKDNYPETAKEVAKIEGEIALVFGFKDALAPMKSVYQMSTENENLKILAGLFEEKFINREEVITLAKLPSREELFAQLLGTISAPLSNFTSVLQGNLRNLISIFNQVSSHNT